MPAGRLSIPEARRVALAAQGFGRPHPVAVGTRQLNALLGRLRLLQLDSVNVFERSHYLPVFARLGGYDKALLDRLTFDGLRRDRYTEAWAHVASLVHVEDWPLLAPKRQRTREWLLRPPRTWAAANGPTLDWLRAELAATGPTTAGAIEQDADRRRGTWWDWSDVKRGLEVLFDFGEVAIAGRRGFERTYGLTEQVLPAEVLGREVDPREAERELIRQSLVALGVGTAREIADYYRLPVAAAQTALAELSEAGLTHPVSIVGGPRSAWVDAGAAHPRRIETAALLSPFDPIVWDRRRAEWLFDFSYRIEIYTPAERRVFGYYTLPVLIDDRIAARVDLKRDRTAGVLRVRSAWREPELLHGDVERIAALIDTARIWQGLERVEVVDRGDLARDLERVLAGSGGQVP